MKIYAIPEDYPFYPPADTADDLVERMIAWAAANGLDARSIVRSSFRITEHDDGSLVASGHLFARDHDGARLVVERAKPSEDDLTEEVYVVFAKTPFSAPVSSLAPAMTEVFA